MRPKRQPAVRRIALTILLIVGGIICLPPLYSAARDLWFLQRADWQYAHFALSDQLRQSLLTWTERQQDSPAVYSIDDPLLFCPERFEDESDDPPSISPTENGWSPEKGNDLLLLALLTFRRDATEQFQTELIAQSYGSMEVIALKACISSSVFSNLCVPPLQQKIAVNAETYDRHYRDSVANSRILRETLCRYLPAAISHRRRQQANEE